MRPPRGVAVTEPAPVTRAVFILRVTRDVVGGAWRGIVELVGADRRTVVSNPPELVDFIERSLDAAAPEDRPTREAGR